MTVGGDARFMGARASRLGVSQRAGVQGAPRIVTESHSRSAPPPIPSRACVPVLRLRAHTARCPIPGSGCPLGETGVGGRGSVPVGVSAPRLDFSLPSPCGVWGCIPLRYACTCVCACVRASVWWDLLSVQGACVGARVSVCVWMLAQSRTPGCREALVAGVSSLPEEQMPRHLPLTTPSWPGLLRELPTWGGPGVVCPWEG